MKKDLEIEPVEINPKGEGCSEKMKFIVWIPCAVVLLFSCEQRVIVIERVDQDDDDESALIEDRALRFSPDDFTVIERVDESAAEPVASE